MWQRLERIARRFWCGVTRDFRGERVAYCIGGPWNGRLVPEPGEVQGNHFPTPAPGGAYVMTDETAVIDGETVACLAWHPEHH